MNNDVRTLHVTRHEYVCWLLNSFSRNSLKFRRCLVQPKNGKTNVISLKRVFDGDLILYNLQLIVQHE